MQPLASQYDPRAVEADSRAFWLARGLPPSDVPLGGATGPLVRLVTGPVPSGSTSLATALRLTRIDAEARWLARTGRRASGTLRAPLGADAPAGPDPAGPLGVWFGGGALLSPQPREAALRRTLIERLSSDRILVSRSVPVQICPTCHRPNSPESVIYQPEEGSAYLVRFPLTGSDPPVVALVWTDAAWKLLATSALLLSPKLTYVVLRRTGTPGGERVLVANSALPRLARWIPDASWEVLEEQPGTTFEGRRYVHPLAIENPALANLPPPGGTVIASEDVEDSGTGLLLLTPAHGVVDGEVAHRLGVPGWPVLGSDGEMSRAFQHKYAGLSRDDAESFIVRDLIDDGSIFAQLSVRRGVPRCARCGTSLIWTPARVWMLDPGRLPPDRLQVFRRVLPGAVMPEPDSSLPWPVSGFVAGPTESTVALSECPQCELLAPDTATEPCSCGGRRTVVTRHLLPEFEEAIAAWASLDTFPDGTAVRLVIPERRRGPAVLHHLVAMHAARRRPGEIRLVPLPALPPVDLVLGADEPLDAARSALLRTRRLSAGRATVEGHRRQETARLRRLWRTCRYVVERAISAGEGADLGAVAMHYSSLLEEDRAFLSTFERLRLEVQREVEDGRWADALERLLRFFEGDLRSGYLRLVAPRLELPGAPPVKQSALRVLLYTVPTWVGLYAPAAPFTTEAIWRAFQGDGASVFQSALPSAQESWIDANLETSYHRWRSLAAAIDRARGELGVAPDARLPAIAIVVAEEELGASLRAQAPILTRLLRAETVEIGSPEHPWQGRRVELRLRPAEVHRAFGTRAARITRMVQGLPTKRIQDGLKSGGLPVVLDGASITLQPGMFESSESLPEGVVPVPWAGGQCFLTLPSPNSAAALGPRPVLSLETHRLVRSVARRLAVVPLTASPGEAIVRIAGPIRAEIADQGPGIARRLHLAKVRVDEPGDAFPASETHGGRTGRGIPWAVWIPGVPRPPRPPKAHRRRSAARWRAPVPAGPAPVPDVPLEFLSEAGRVRDEGLRALLADLDNTPVGPAIGLAKLGGVWDHGFHDRAQIATAPFELIAALPGFGPEVARELIRSVGGVPPPRPPRVLRIDPPPEAPFPARPATTLAPGPALSPPTARSPGISEVEPARVTAGIQEPPAPPPAPVRPAEFVPRDPPRPVVPVVAPPEPVPVSRAPTAPAEVAPPLDPYPEPTSPRDPEPSAAYELGNGAVSRVPPNETAPTVPEMDPEYSSPEGTPETSAQALEPAPPEALDADGSEVSEVPAEAAPETESVEAEWPGPPVEPVPAVPASDQPITSPEPGPEPTARSPEPAPSALVDPNAAEPAGEAPEVEPERGPVDPEPTGPAAVPGGSGSVEDPESPDALIELGEDSATSPAPNTTPLIGEGAEPSVPEVEESPPEEAEPPNLVAPEEPGPAARPADPLVGAAPVETVGDLPAPEPTPPGPVAELPASGAPAVEPVPEPVRPSEGEEGVLLLEGPAIEPSRAPFLEATAAGHRGLWLTRDPPDRVRVHLHRREIEVAWITSLPRPGAIRPSDLAGLSQRILSALQEGRATVVLFEGIEYLVSLHSADAALPSLRAIDAEARVRHARVWIPLNPDLLPPPELEALRSATDSRAARPSG